jgi:hypothetical protein
MQKKSKERQWYGIEHRDEVAIYFNRKLDLVLLMTYFTIVTFPFVEDVEIRKHEKIYCIYVSMTEMLGSRKAKSKKNLLQKITAEKLSVGRKGHQGQLDYVLF